MKTASYVMFAALMAAGIASCRQDMGWRQPLGEDETKPQPISDPVVRNGNGKAEISYTLPNDPRVLYVSARYTMSNGQQMEVKSTYYANELSVEGFADTNTYRVELSTVSRAGVRSDPVSVSVSPLEAPIWQVFRSIEMTDAFGGYNLAALNQTKADIAILVLRKNEFGEWSIDNNKSIYTQPFQGLFASLSTRAVEKCDLAVRASTYAFDLAVLDFRLDVASCLGCILAAKSSRR